MIEASGEWPDWSGALRGSDAQSLILPSRWREPRRGPAAHASKSTTKSRPGRTGVSVPHG